MVHTEVSCPVCGHYLPIRDEEESITISDGPSLIVCDECGSVIGVVVLPKEFLDRLPLDEAGHIIWEEDDAGK